MIRDLFARTVDYVCYFVGNHEFKVLKIIRYHNMDYFSSSELQRI